MTARMLRKLCEAGRMRAYESAYLMERATTRARKQLAALRAPTAETKDLRLWRGAVDAQPLAGDFLAKDRKMPAFKQGELVAVMSAGAYGFSMSSEYNLRKRPKEVLITGTRTNDISYNPHSYVR